MAKEPTVKQSLEQAAAEPEVETKPVNGLIVHSSFKDDGQPEVAVQGLGNTRMTEFATLLRMALALVEGSL